MKKKHSNKNLDFVLINPGLENPRANPIPKNFTPDEHVQNSINATKGLYISQLLEKTFIPQYNNNLKDAISDLIANGLNSRSSSIDLISEDLVKYLESINGKKSTPEHGYDHRPAMQNKQF